MLDTFSSEPPLKPNQPSQRMKVPSVASGRLAPGMALMEPSLPYLPLRGAEQQHAGQGRGGAAQVHDAGAGEVVEAEAVEEAAAPLPVALHRIDETGHDHGEQQEGPQLHALGHGAGDDGHGGGDEDDLEEEVGHQRSSRSRRRCEHLFDRVIATEHERPVDLRDDAVAAAGYMMP
jgi:hypothetical protein